MAQRRIKNRDNLPKIKTFPYTLDFSKFTMLEGLR